MNKLSALQIKHDAGAKGGADSAGLVAVVLASACWGTSGLFVKLLLAEIGTSAIALAFWRDAITFLLLSLLIVLYRPRWLLVDKGDLGWLLGLGGSLGVFHVFWNMGVMINGAAVATVQQAAMPAIVTLLARLIWLEPLTQPKLLAIVLTFTGTVLVSGLDHLVGAEISASGLLIGFGIPVMYASWNLFGKKVRQRHNPFTTLTYAFAFGTLVLLPLQLATSQPLRVSPYSVLWFAALVTVSTIVPFLIYTFALGRLPASLATILAMSEIAFVAMYAHFLLHERLTASQVAGAVLVVVGVSLLFGDQRQNLGRRRPRGQYQA